MKQNYKKTNYLLLVLIVFTLSISPGCLSPDKGWYTPKINANFNYINLPLLEENFTSLGENYTNNNFSATFYIDQGKNPAKILHFELPDNITYVISNRTFNISGTIGSIIDESSYNDRIWMSMRLFGEKYVQYKFSSKEEAKNASYLLEPSFELIKYFLNESGNPMPSDVEYGVW